MGSFYNKDLTKEERLEKITGRIDHLKSEIEKHKKNLVMIKEKNIESLNRKYLRDVPRWISLQEVAIADMENEIDLINKGQITDFGQGQTNYYTEAQKLCGSSDYYKRPNELFARAFESWVFDEIKDRGGSSDYLVHSVSDGLFAGDEFKGNPYPSGDERKTINSKLVLFTDAVKAEVEMHLENSSTPRM